jgi:hypothetical protein
LRPSPPPHPPPAEPPATAARGRRRSRDRLAALPSSKLFLRRSSAGPPPPPGLPSKPRGHLFLLRRRRTPTPSPKFQCSLAARSRLPVAFSAAASRDVVDSSEVDLRWTARLRLSLSVEVWGRRGARDCGGVSRQEKKRTGSGRR